MQNIIKTICDYMGNPSVFEVFEQKSTVRVDRPFYSLKIDGDNYNKYEELILKLMDCKDQQYVYWTDRHDLKYMNYKYLQSVCDYIFDDDRKLFTSWEFCYLHDIYVLDMGIELYFKRYKENNSISIREILDSEFYAKMTSWLAEKREFEIDRNKPKKISQEELLSSTKEEIETENNIIEKPLSTTQQIDFMIQENITESKMDQAACGIIVNYNNSILLVKQIKTEYNDESWTLPGGGIDLDESFEDGYKRWGIKDLGLEIEVDELIGTLDLYDYFGIDILQYNIISYLTEIPVVTIDQTRYSEYEFIRLDKIKELYLQKPISEVAFQSLMPLIIV